MIALTIEKAPQTGLVWWVPLLLAVVGLVAATALLVVRAPAADTPARRGPVDRLMASLRHLTGLPAWAAASIGLSFWSLSVALIGFSWDVAWHADLGRDNALFTPPHVMILVGLAGIGLAGVVAIVLASLDRAEVGLHAGPLRIPWSAMPIGLMGLGAVVGFPIDDYWHRVYGIDVTMWSPTHLLMIGGASLTPLATWLILAEAGVAATGNRVVRILSEALAAATLVGLSTFQLEFDLGIPQWQALFQPVLMALAMGIGLVAAREALGPGGALRATLGFLVLRGVTALLVGPVFGLSLERFPLYLGGALCVEAAWYLLRDASPVTRTLVAGLLIGTVGTGVEWGFTHLWGLQPWQTGLLPSWWVVIGAALAGAVLGSALGRAVAHQPRLVAYPAVGLAFVALMALLAVPYPRHGASVAAAVSCRQVGPTVPAITRDGSAALERQMSCALSTSPSDGAAGADLFRIIAWQGGDIVLANLTPAGNGSWTTETVIPTGGDWKSLVLLLKGDVVAAVPVDFPADSEYGLDAIPAPVTQPRTATFAPASFYLTRESHDGSAVPAILAYSVLAIVAVAWGVALIGVGTAMSRELRGRLRFGSGRPRA